MKRRWIAVILALVLVVMLTSCSVDAAPKVKKANFDFSVTYEEWGETKTISGVFVCKYAGRSFTLEGGNFTRNWDGHIEGIEHAEEEYNTAVLIKTTEDGGKIYLDFSLSAAHMMGEPYLADAVIEPTFFLVYSNEDNTSSWFGGDANEIEEIYGLKIVDYQYDAPVENVFGSSK